MSHPDLLNRKLPDWNLGICTLKNLPMQEAKHLGGATQTGKNAEQVDLPRFPDTDTSLSGPGHNQREGASGRLLAALCSDGADNSLAPHTESPDSGAVTVCAPRGPGGLWSSAPRSPPFPADYAMMQVVQATMILSTILCCVAFLLFLLQLFRLKQGQRFILTSIIQLLSCK